MKPINIILCALFAALSAVLSQAGFTIGVIPINLTHVSVFLAAGLLGARRGAISQLVFVLLGAFGVPVFSGMSGGLSHIAGPTGGFIIGYILCAFMTGFIIDRYGTSVKVLVAAMLAGWAATYIPGIAWFMIQMQTGIAATLSMCVWPYMPGDLAKTVLCVVLIVRLRPLVRKATQEA